MSDELLFYKAILKFRDLGLSKRLLDKRLRDKRLLDKRLLDKKFGCIPNCRIIILNISFFG